jgi:hypothetical protein
VWFDLAHKGKGIMLHSGKFIGVIVIGLILARSPALSAAPSAKLWPRWLAHEAQSTRTIDHTPWDVFLRTYVIAPHPSGINRVRYGDVTPADRQALQEYIAALQAVPITAYNRQEQKAYWINLYNALTVELVLEHYPVDSIRNIDISPGLFSDGPWGAKLASVEGAKVSLDDIEHRILRSIWQDNRIHYAVNYASLGCPNLLPVAYTASNVEHLLEQGARDYVNHSRGVAFERGALRVSGIYVWFKEDFDGSVAGILRHLRRYANGALAKRLAAYSGRLKTLYDWRLNAP